jgi:outer membrane protein OmpA-like peptidoglycan-associated protein
MEKAMLRFSDLGSYRAAISGLIMLAACSMQNQRPMKVNVYHISFAADSYSIDPAGQQAIADVAAAVEGNNAALVTIVGRSDATGSPDYSKHMSRKRAAAVHDALIATGKITPDRVEVVWSSETRAADGATLNDMPALGNRVVDMFIR